MVNGELVAIPGRPRRTKSACPEQCDASFRLDFHAFEVPLETIGERREIVIEIVEHAFCIVEPQQRPRGAIWLDPATEDRRPEHTAPLFMNGRKWSIALTFAGIGPGKQCST